jgi:membrane protease YdiL (CAAX protease family)
VYERWTYWWAPPWGRIAPPPYTCPERPVGRRRRRLEIAPRPPRGAPDAITPRLAPWPAWVAPASVGVGIALIFVSAFVLIAIAAAARTTLTDPPPGVELASGALTSLTLLASALLTARLTGHLRPWQFGLSELRVLRSLGWMTIAIAGFALLFGALVATLVLLEGSSLHDLFEGGAVGMDMDGPPVDSHSGPALAASAVVAIAVVAPVCEEVFFRGVMFGSLRGWKGVWIAAAITAVVFSAAHLEFAPLVFADRLIAGFVWCLVYARSGRLLPGIMAHAANNAVVIGLLLGWDWQVPLLVAGCVATVTLLVAPFARRRTGRPRPEAILA